MTVFKSLWAKTSGVRLYARLAAVLTLAACVSLPPTENTEYSDSYGNEVLGAGFTLISDRYIEPISLHDLAVSGMSGLRSLDAQLDVVDREIGRASCRARV